MADYQKMYSVLFNGISECLEQTREITKKLIFLQKQAEEIYLESTDHIAVDNTIKVELE